MDLSLAKVSQLLTGMETHPRITKGLVMRGFAWDVRECQSRDLNLGVPPGHWLF